MHIYIENDTNALPTANLQKTELQVYMKYGSCRGNCITGNEGRFLRNVNSDGADIEKVQCAGA